MPGVHWTRYERAWKAKEFLAYIYQEEDGAFTVWVKAGDTARQARDFYDLGSAKDWAHDQLRTAH